MGTTLLWVVLFDFHVMMIPIEDLLHAYKLGIFPMSPDRNDNTIEWYLPRFRGVLPIDNFRVSKNVLKWIRNKPHQVRIDTCFREVVLACADREETWISDTIIDSYENLFRHGYAHSVEIWVDEQLVGGLYGVHLQSAFFGETMFKKIPEVDKVALYYCHQILQKNQFSLWDTQYWTEHLSQFGCISISNEEYQKILKRALQTQSQFAL